MENPVPVNTFINIVAAHCGWTPEAVDTYLFKSTINDAFAHIDNLRLEQIKRVVRDLKNEGFHTLLLTGNKPFFVNTLCNVLQRYKASTNPAYPQIQTTSSTPRIGNVAVATYPPKPAAPTLAVPTGLPSSSVPYVPHKGTVYNQQTYGGSYSQSTPPTSVPPYAPRSYSNGPTYPVPPVPPATSSRPPQPPNNNIRPTPVQMQRIPPNQNQHTSSRPAANVYNDAAAPAASSFNPFAVCSNGQTPVKAMVTPAQKPIKLSDKNMILNTRDKYEIFYKLSVMSGITKEDILREIQACPEDKLEEDYILYQIISKKDPEAANSMMFAPSSKAQEDAELDRAILESEKERDNIQDRKRKRTSCLKTDIQCEIIPAEEFGKSIILWGTHRVKADQKSSSSSSSNKLASTKVATATSPLPKPLTGGNGTDISNSVFGCSVVKLICLFFDHCGVDVDAIELIEVVESELFKLRSMCVDLLLLEKDAVKYYKDASYAYMTSLCHTVDSATHLHAALSTPIRNVKSHSKLNNNDYKVIQQYLRTDCAKIRDILSVELTKFQKGLYKIPSDGGLIPDIFRRKRLIPYINMLSSQIDEDGFEVVNNCASLNLLSDVENEGLEESEDEDFSDDD